MIDTYIPKIFMRKKKYSIDKSKEKIWHRSDYQKHSSYNKGLKIFKLLSICS